MEAIDAGDPADERRADPEPGLSQRQTAAVLYLDDATLRALMDDAWSEYVGSLNQELAGNQELADYFKRLRSRHRTGSLSNGFVGAREEAHRLSELCDVIVYSP